MSTKATTLNSKKSVGALVKDWMCSFFQKY